MIKVDEMKPIIFGHRGASGYEFENTIASFEKALEMGADGLETDMWLTADNQVVLHHDKAITIPGQPEPGNISKMTLKEIQEIKLPNGEIIPSLNDFLCKYADRKTIDGNPVLFSIDMQDLKVAEFAIPLIKEFNLVNRTFLCGTSMLYIRKARKLDSDVVLVASNQQDQISDENLQSGGKYSEIHAYAFNIQGGEYKPSMNEILSKYGLKCFIWDLHTEKKLRDYLPYKPYAIYSNYPDLAVKIRNEVLN
jgi:glycerophosphoryl diester phosphodiesterase